MKIGATFNKAIHYINQGAKAVYQDISSEGPALKELTGIIRDKAKAGYRLTRRVAKSEIRYTKEFNKEYSVLGEVKRLKDDIKEACVVGKVYSAGVENPEASKLIYQTRDGLEAYAKANKLNITFYTPKKNELGGNDFEKPLEITLVRNGGIFGSSNIARAVIDGDADKITKRTTIDFSANPKRASIQHFEDNLLRRIYAQISRLNHNIKQDH